MLHGWIQPKSPLSSRKFPFNRWTGLLLYLWTRAVPAPIPRFPLPFRRPRPPVSHGNELLCSAKGEASPALAEFLAG